MLIIDTAKDTQYKGNISVACEKLRLGECDEIITRGSDFVCVKYEDPELAARAREQSLKRLGNSEIRYIVIAQNEDGQLYLGSKSKLQPDISHSAFFKSRQEAERVMINLDSPGYCYHVEEYLYRVGNNCRLRIYYTIKGLKTDYGVLQFIREQVEKGHLESRLDSKNKPYVWLDDLLKYKDELIVFNSAAGIKYKRKFNLELVLHDGLIAFDSIYKFVQQYPECDIPEVKYLTANSAADTRRKFYDLGAVFYQDKHLQELACKELGLEEWL